MKELLKNFYGFHTYCGDLFIFGDNMEICKPYLNDIKVESIEEVLEYCKEHKLRAYLYQKRSIKGIIGFISTYFSAKKMGVYSTWENILQYLEQ